MPESYESFSVLHQHPRREVQSAAKIQRNKERPKAVAFRRYEQCNSDPGSGLIEALKRKHICVIPFFEG
jgi:hypothetical protein